MNWEDKNVITKKCAYAQKMEVTIWKYREMVTFNINEGIYFVLTHEALSYTYTKPYLE